jgi:ribosomal protein S21
MSAQPFCSRFGEKVVSPTRDVRRGQVVRPKLDGITWGPLNWITRLSGKSLEKKLAIWPTSPHVIWCIGSFIAVGSVTRHRPNSDLRHRPGACAGYSRVQVTPMHLNESPMQVLVRDNNIDQALRVLKKKMRREGVFREMKRRRFCEKPSEQATRESMRHAALANVPASKRYEMD